MLYAIPKGIDCTDVHNHVAGNADGTLNTVRAQALLEGATRLNIHRICISQPLTSASPEPEEVRRANDHVLEAMAMDKRFIGFCFVNPLQTEIALEEIDRCIVERGMVGIKLYHQLLICDEAQRPVLEHAAELGIPVLMHAGKVTDETTRKRQPNLSNAAHFVKACNMFPDTMFIQGHIGGGGDWEWNLRELEKRPGSYIDISGSVIDAGIIRRTVDAIGADRVLFATDGVLEEGVGKLLDANLDKNEMQAVCQGNFERIMNARRV